MNAHHRFVLIICLLGLSVNAQKVKFNCQGAFTAFEEKVSAGDYSGALSALPELRKNCRGFNEKMYVYGETILKSKIETSRIAEEKKTLVNDLSALYTEYDKYYPQSDASVKKAMLLYKNKLASEEEVYSLLDTAFKGKRKSFTDYNSLETYFLLYLKKYQEDSKAGITPEQFIEKFDEVSGQVRAVSTALSSQRQQIVSKQETQALTNEENLFLKDSEAAIESLATVSENINILASKHFTCDKLDAFYEKKYEVQRGDAAWVEAMVNILLNNKCYRSDILLKGALAVHQARPSSQSAFNLGTILQRKNDIKGAVAYYEESAQLEPNQQKKADLYYRIASVFRNSDKAAAKRYALEAARINPATAKPYILLAELYTTVSKECGLNAFEQKALVWLSIETIKKAEAAEAKYKPTVAAMIEDYKKRLPSKEEISGAGKRMGDKITYGCWINETVTIPNTKK